MPLSNPSTLIVADTETGGLDPFSNPILTLSALRTSDGASFNVKIKPPEGLDISPDALKVTGIDVEDLHLNGIPEAEAAEQFCRFISGEGHVIAGCNFPFDMRFLNEMFRRNNIPSPLKHRCVDLQTVAFLAHEKGLIDLPSSKSGVLLLNLNVVSNAFGVARASNLHDSLEDVILTQRCIEEGISLLKNKETKGTEKPRTNLVVLDVETSGLNPSKHSLLRISAKRLSDGSTFDHWVKPEHGRYGDKKSLSKTKIDTKKLSEEGEGLPDVLRKLSRFLAESGPHILSGCNVAFDVDFIEEGCRRHGLRPPFGGKRVDLQTVAFVAHECGDIVLPQKNGVVDLSFDSIAGACGIQRKSEADRDPHDMEIVHCCLERCTGMSFKKEAGLALPKNAPAIEKSKVSEFPTSVG